MDPESMPILPDHTSLVLRVASPILLPPGALIPGDLGVLTPGASIWVCREYPPNPGMWLGFYEQGLVSPHSHGADETLSSLVALVVSPPDGSPPSRQRWSRRPPRTG